MTITKGNTKADPGSHWVTGRSRHPFYLRRVFFLKAQPVEATLLACGLGQYNSRLNGQRVGDHFLDPAWTDYNRLVLYNRFEVSNQLHAGANALVMEVGNGWYLWDTEFGYSFHFPPFMPPNPNPYRPFGESLVCTFVLTVTYPDGTREQIVSDEQCKTTPHGVRHTNVYGSEMIDGTRLLCGDPGRVDCSLSDYDDSGWEPARPALEAEIPKGELKEASLPPVRPLRRYPARFLGKRNGRSIYDLGQNISGILEAEVSGKAGTTMNFYPAEKLDAEGSADQMAKNWMLIDNVISYRIASDDTPERFSQTFTYFSGRYLAVEGEGQVNDLSALAISSAWKRAGSFSCDDERYNRIYDMIEKTVEANMLGVHTDCPTIERFAWQEPNHLMAPSIFFMKDGKALWEKFLTDLRLAQHTADDRFHDMEGNLIAPGDGLVPSQAPCYIPNVLPVPGMGSFYDIVPWGSTCILGVWWHYLFYGDIRIIKDNYETGKRYLEYLKTRINGEGFLNHGLGDWGNPENQLARENIETAFLYADAVTLARFAGLLGKTVDEEALLVFSGEIRENYNKKLLTFHEELGIWCYQVWGQKGQITQAAEALPLFWGMVPAEHEADVVKAFTAALDRKDALSAGEIGLPYVIQTARRYHLNNRIHRYITRTEHPSYYAFILDGETTLGEYWEKNPRSHCHDMMGHIIEWFYNGIAGIEPLEPGFQRVRISPWMPEDMNQFTCTYNTPLGPVTVTGFRKAEGEQFTATVPYGMKCETSKGVKLVRTMEEK